MMTKIEMLKSFGAKVAEYCVDITIDKIREADKNRKVNGQSRESRIYQVVIDAMNEFPYNGYKKTEQVYDAAESILMQFKSGKDDIKENVRAGLKMIVSQVTIETCEDFLRVLHHEICKDKNDTLYKEIILLQGMQTFETVREGFDVSNNNDEETLKKLDHVIEGINSIDKKIDGIENNETKHYEALIKNRSDEYAQKWNKNMFLNDFNKRDKYAGVNIKLREIYLDKHLPHYVWKVDNEPLNDLKELLSEYTVDNNDKRMLLILGQAGIGKSTLITWMMANLVERKEDILVYQIASDLDSIDWQSKNVLKDIFSVIGLKYNELENKTLILDGFDEIHTDSDRERILNKLNQELKRLNALRAFSVIITCRENYIYNLHNMDCDYIVLQAWDEVQIESFCRAYWEKCGNDILNDKIQNIQKNSAIFGIPLILYMILALDITIEKNGSIVDIYDQIFSLKRGGIYDRGYDVEHRINEPETKRHIHHISQRIAFWMFENNADEATISQEKFEEICENEMIESGEKDEEIQTDTLIGNFFRLKHCEGKGTNELQFVHRSIYEYFVVVYFFESIHELRSKEEVAGKLGELLKDGLLSKQILEFIKTKFDSMEGENFINNIREVFDMMLRDGMTYNFIKKYKEPLLDILVREMNIFFNMLEVMHLWNSKIGELDHKISNYLRYNHRKILILKGIELREIDLGGAHLSEANLEGADLSGTNLSEADLSEANLSQANLTGADLSYANLFGANLASIDLTGAYITGANLTGADLLCANLKKAELTGANLKGAYLLSAHLEETDLVGADLAEAYLVGANLTRANLFRANLFKIDLEGADLNETLFDECQVELLCGKYDLNSSLVLIAESNEIINCKEYCIRKQKKGI